MPRAVKPFVEGGLLQRGQQAALGKHPGGLVHVLGGSGHVGAAGLMPHSASSSHRLSPVATAWRTGVSPLPGAMPQTKNLRHGSFAFGETAESCASNRPL